MQKITKVIETYTFTEREVYHRLGLSNRGSVVLLDVDGKEAPCPFFRDYRDKSVLKVRVSRWR